MKIRLAGIQADSIVDGEGIRLAIFVQGCPHHCEGCHNPETHDYDGGYESDTDEIIRMMDENPLLDGITLSGGEPFMQPQSCAAIVEGAKKRGLSVWCYTGFVWEDLVKNPAAMGLLEKVDVLIDGRFEIDKRSLDLYFKGSTNQRVIDVKKSLKGYKICIYHE